MIPAIHIKNNFWINWFITVPNVRHVTLPSNTDVADINIKLCVAHIKKRYRPTSMEAYYQNHQRVKKRCFRKTCYIQWKIKL